MDASRNTRWKIIGVWTCAIGIFAVVVALTVQIFILPATSPAPRQPSAPIAEQPLDDGEFQELRRTFGPWQLAGTSTDHTLVMLMNNGSIEMASWTVKTDQTWVPRQQVEVESVAIEGRRALIKLNSGETYGVTVGQVFIIERHPLAAFAVVSEGGAPHITQASIQHVWDTGQPTGR